MSHDAQDEALLAAARAARQRAFAPYSGFFVGADVRYMYPFKKGTTANGGEISNASLGFFGTVGMSI